MLPACFSGLPDTLNKPAACSTKLTEKLVSDMGFSDGTVMLRGGK